MSAYNYESLFHDVRAMEGWKILSLVAVCVEKVAPIVHLLGLPTTWHATNKCMALAWSTAKSLPSSKPEATRLAEELESAPEWQCDPDNLLFVVAQALSFSEFVLRAIAADSNSVRADNVGFSTLLELAELFDLAIEQHPAISEHEDSCKTSIYTSEQSSQIMLIELLKRSEQPSAQLFESLHGEATKMSRLFESALPTYCYHYVWTLLRTQEERES
jgi:hypothetical protein